MEKVKMKQQCVTFFVFFQVNSTAKLEESKQEWRKNRLFHSALRHEVVLKCVILDIFLVAKNVHLKSHKKISKKHLTFLGEKKLKEKNPTSKQNKNKQTNKYTPTHTPPHTHKQKTKQSNFLRFRPNRLILHHNEKTKRNITKTSKMENLGRFCP